MIKNIENGFNRLAQVIWAIWIFIVLVVTRDKVIGCIFNGNIVTNFKHCYEIFELLAIWIFAPLIPYWIIAFVWRGFMNKNY